MNSATKSLEQLPRQLLQVLDISNFWQQVGAMIEKLQILRVFSRAKYIFVFLVSSHLTKLLMNSGQYAILPFEQRKQHISQDQRRNYVRSKD
jgi:hypothetical protein